MSAAGGHNAGPFLPERDPTAGGARLLYTVFSGIGSPSRRFSPGCIRLTDISSRRQKKTAASVRKLRFPRRSGLPGASCISGWNGRTRTGGFRLRRPVPFPLGHVPLSAACGSPCPPRQQRAANGPGSRRGIPRPGPKSWNGRTRTGSLRLQRPRPYHLATFRFLLPSSLHAAPAPAAEGGNQSGEREARSSPASRLPPQRRPEGKPAAFDLGGQRFSGSLRSRPGQVPPMGVLRTAAPAAGAVEPVFGSAASQSGFGHQATTWSTTRISSIDTCSRTSRMIRLSTVGRATPFCHL